ncbi:MAG: M67 family metallopeptidase [Clostridiales bacterium]|nr:M67 family metallopeptidase [Clostridiales bacterium]
MITLKQADYSRMVNHARQWFPYESCGLIAGVRADGVKQVRQVYLLTNTDKSETHFSIDPAEHLEAVKDMRAGNLSPLGNFHSHPATPARPSREDIRLAYDRNASYLILSLQNRDDPVLKAFHIENGEAREEPIELIP